MISLIREIQIFDMSSLLLQLFVNWSKPQLNIILNVSGNNLQIAFTGIYSVTKLIQFALLLK